VGWEKSVQLDNTFYIVHRNLGLAYRDIQKDYTKALESMNKASACNSDDPRLLVEVDGLYELNKVSAQKKYEFLKSRKETAKKRSDALLRLATRTVENGKFDEAIAILTTNNIRESEGARELQNAYLNAFTLRGLESLKKGKFDKALKDIETAQNYPGSIAGRARSAQFDYLTGMIYKKSGKNAEAGELFKKTLDVIISKEGADREYLYYQGLALKELGRTEESKQLFQKMLDDILNKEGDNAFFTQFESGQSGEARIALNHYLAGLAYEGLGDKAKAKSEYSETLKINPGHIWSKIHMESL
jgi:tetratricopeptide (TPR) repeat protein